MFKIKHIALVSVALFVAFASYAGYTYHTYEQKQEEVKAFRDLALKGYAAVNANRNDEALAHYEKAVALYDKDSRSLKDLAYLYRKKGETAKARELYQKAYDANNDDFKALFNAALLDYVLKDHNASIKKAKTLIDHNKNATKYYRLLAANYYALGMKKEAFENYAVLKQRGYKKIGDALTKEVAEAYEALKAKPEAKPVVYAYTKTDDIKELEKLMLKYKKEGYDMKSLRTAQKILFSEPENDAANKTAATLLHAHNANKEAYDYAKAVKNHDAQSYEALGASCQNRAEYAEAIEAYEKAYALKPSKELLRAMAVCALKKDDVEKLAEYVDKLYEIDPLLATKLLYAIEIQSGIKHTITDKIVYLMKLEYYKLYCKVAGCASEEEG